MLRMWLLMKKHPTCLFVQADKYLWNIDNGRRVPYDSPLFVSSL